MKTKVYKVEVLIIDHDGIGEEGIKGVLENARYANRCISPMVKGFEVREVEWEDSHPLNFKDSCEQAYLDLFSSAGK